MSDAGKPITLFAECPRCNRGAEACQYCENVAKEDWEVICDCGLYDFGVHLLACDHRHDRKYVVAADHNAAKEKRAD